jgi:prepilin peptidase CpaA
MSDVSLFLLLAAAAWSDWRMRKVPNRLTFPFMTAGLLYQFWQGTAVSALAGILLAFVLTLFPAMLRGLGMGDQKLLMAAGAWTNPEQVYLLFLYALCSCLLTAICVPSRWPRLRTNMILFAAGWYGHRQLWFPERTASALSFPFAVHLLVAFTAERIGR